MTNKEVMYAVQPAFNENYVPTGPPNYMPAGPPSYEQTVGMRNVSDSVLPASAPVVAPVFAPVVGPHAAVIQCPHCLIRMKTKIKTVPQKSAHIACALLFIFGCCLCSCVPYCMKSCKDIHHYCQSCNGFIGTYRS